MFFKVFTRNAFIAKGAIWENFENTGEINMISAEHSSNNILNAVKNLSSWPREGKFVLEKKNRRTFRVS